QHVEQVRLAGVLSDVRAPHGDRHDFRARGLDRLARLIEVFVLAGPDEQARTKRPTGHLQQVVAHSATADCVDDFDAVPGGERRAVMLAARTDRAIDLDREPLALEAEVAQERADRGAGRDRRGTAVDGNRSVHETRNYTASRTRRSAQGN